MPSPKMNPLPRAELLAVLKSLGLHHLAANLDDFIARAEKGRLPILSAIEEFAKTELTAREQRSLQRRIVWSRAGKFKPMADFDWNWPKEIDRASVERALSGRLVQNRENLVLVASQGLGKTMIAKNLVHQTVMAGYTAIFIEAPNLVIDLGSQESSRALELRLRHYSQPDLLCIDEVGYLSYDSKAADLLFQIVSRRYEKKSLVITTNLAFSDWPTVFPSASCTTALIDRLTHHSDVIHIEGESFRKREAEQNKRNRKLP